MSKSIESLGWKSETKDILKELMEIEDAECKNCVSKALSLLLSNERTEKNLSDKLYAKGYSQKAIDYSIQYAKAYGYLDDRRYATNYIYCNKLKRSRLELKYKLRDRGVPDDIIGEAMLEYTTEDERIALKAILEKKLSGKVISDVSKKDKDKMVASLSRKGFSTGMVISLLEEMLKDE